MSPTFIVYPALLLDHISIVAPLDRLEAQDLTINPFSLQTENARFNLL